MLYIIFVVLLYCFCNIRIMCTQNNLMTSGYYGIYSAYIPALIRTMPVIRNTSKGYKQWFILTEDQQNNRICQTTTKTILIGQFH